MNDASSEITDSNGGICAERAGGHPNSPHLTRVDNAAGAGALEMMRRNATLLHFEGSGEEFELSPSGQRGTSAHWNVRREAAIRDPR
jgi:hypothetical protein